MVKISYPRDWAETHRNLAEMRARDLPVGNARQRAHGEYVGAAFDVYGTLLSTALGGLLPLEKIPDGWNREPPFNVTLTQWRNGFRLACLPLAVYETVAQPVYWMARGARSVKDMSLRTQSQV